MKLVVGLGNPGIQYMLTRHNVGFMVIDHIKYALELGDFKSGFKGEYIKTKIENEDYIFYKPFTYMNDSGSGVIEIVNYFKINIEDILVISDDLDLDVGFVRIREKGGNGGHNGLKSVSEHLNTTDYKKIRIGISKPIDKETINYVLGKFDSEEIEKIKIALRVAKEAIIYWANNDFNKVMSKYNYHHNEENS